jgi:regulator of protease activity HflC (stomatin/prohibitin superfamily)
MDLVQLIFLLAAAIPVLLAVRVVPETERFIVFRLGKLYGVLEPGLRWVLPGLDQVIRVDLNGALPNWQSLSEPDLQAQLRQLALSGQLPTSL